MINISLSGFAYSAQDTLITNAKGEAVPGRVLVMEDQQSGISISVAATREEVEEVTGQWRGSALVIGGPMPPKAAA